MNTFISLTAATLREAAAIKDKIDELGSQLVQILGGGFLKPSAPAGKTTGKKRGRRKMSAASRARMAAAQKARWAKAKGKSVVAKTTVNGAKKKRTMSPEGRARIAAAQRARWAKKKA